MKATIPMGLGLGTLLVWAAAATYPGGSSAAQDADQWRAGVAAVVLTPERSMWMAGYAARNKPSEGKVHDLYAKALAMQEAGGTRLVVVTCDLIGIPRQLRDRVQRRVQSEYGLPPAGLLLAASHTHCGPELRASKAALYGLGPERVRQATEYLKRLEEKLVALVGQALTQLSPAKLHYSHARCGFAMNRRLKTKTGYRNHPNPDGPVDHDVPVLWATDSQGKLRAVLFGYACHNTTLGFYQFCGDYAGFAQQYLQQAHPGTTALFVAGCGGDQNPYPRRTLELAQQHGRSLANAVEAALQTRPRPVRGPLRLALGHVQLAFAPPPSRQELERLSHSKNKYDRRRAAALLEQLDRDGRIPTEYPYPVQVAQFGDDLTLVALAGEAVVDYSLRLKRELSGPAVWVAAYCNDVFGYVPSRRVLTEGGYEGGGAVRYSLLPGPFAPSVEKRIVAKVHELVKQVRTEAAASRQ